GDSLRSIFARMKKYGMLYISSGSLVEIETAGEFTPEQFKALQDVATWWKSKTGQSFVQPKDLKVHSIHLSKSLIVKSKREAKRRGISLSQFVNEAIAINIENEI
ncbi:MAG: hypothetical protein QGI15_05075, partial [Candidatus Scalindua sp.]|nr:hypothetical protein [Candidatus Scalindua sp.]